MDHLTPSYRILGCLALASVATLVACSSSSSATGGAGGDGTTGTSSSSSVAGGGTGGSGGSGGTTAASSGSSSDGGGSNCAPGAPFGGGETKVTGQQSVTAKIVDEKGAPIAAGQPVFICGIDLCSNPATTDATGSVTITTSLAMKKPAFKVGDALTYAELAIPLSAATTDFTAGGTKVLSTAKLSGATGAAFKAGSTVSSGGVSLVLAAATNVEVNQLIYDTDDKQLFRAVSIPLDNDGPWLASSGHTDFSLLYGVSPAGTTFCPAATATVALPHATSTPNDFGWAAGTAVEIWVMTTDVGQTYAPYAGWAKASDATVDADGTSVTTVAGQGLTYLDNFAIRKKQ